VTIVGAPAFARGVRLRREPDGTAFLLVPEGVVRLNATAAAALALVDGKRSVGEIVAELVRANFDAESGRISDDVCTLFERLKVRRFLR
jgi:pyrroloquinoline quinone biosynthesis protein D